MRAVVALVMSAWAVCPQEPPKPPAKPEPPVVRLVQPIGVEAGKPALAGDEALGLGE